MIKSDRGNIEISGIEPEILTDLSFIVKGLLKCKNMTREKIEAAIRVGFMTPEERSNEIAKLVAERLSTPEGNIVMDNLIKEIFGEEK